MNNLISDEEAADKWVFETNGKKWSNNDNTAGDNYGSFLSGCKHVRSQQQHKDELLKEMASKLQNASMILALNDCDNASDDIDELLTKYNNIAK